MIRKTLVLFVLFACSCAFAQKNDDADQQKIIDIEQQFAANTGAAGPASAEVVGKYLYDGQVGLVDSYGRHSRMSKSDVIGMVSKPDPSDPDAKSVYKVSDFQVDIYGDTALAAYKQSTTDSGHKNAALNGDSSQTCLDTFIKRNGQWYALASSCTPAAPMSQAQWDAATKK